MPPSARRRDDGVQPEVMWRLLTAVAFAFALTPPHVTAQTQQPAASVSVDASGHYEIHFASPTWTFGGDVGPLRDIRATDGQDSIGAYHQAEFDYATRTSAIRAYHDTPVVLFSTTYSSAGANSDPFPALKTLPSLPYRLSYGDTPFSP